MTQLKQASPGIIIIIFIIMLSAFFFLISSVFSLTVIEGKTYASLSEHNSLNAKPNFGERGLITDKAGIPLVTNTKAYSISINTLVLTEEEATAIFPEQIERIKEAFSAKNKGVITIMQHAPKDLVVRLKEKLPAGVSIDDMYVRNYPYNELYAHIIGYTGVASEADLEADVTLVRNEIVGKNGLEFQYDTKLRGEVSYEVYEKDAYGNPVSTTSDRVPNPGNSLQLSIDNTQQAALYTAIKNAVDKSQSKGGSGVVVNIHTGEIIAMASYPSFNPNEFVSGISYKSYATLINNPQTPLLNRPIAAQEPPGSTFKTIVGAAALEVGAITPDTIYNATGVIQLSGGQPFQDYRKRVFGPLTVRDALMVSSNIFFCRAMIELSIDRFIPFAEAFGIGVQTGIDLPGEMKGRVPSPENKIALARAGATWLDPVWYPEGDSCNSAIGQGITLATPMQMAQVAAIIANGGNVYKPHLVTSITDIAGKTNTIQPILLRRSIVGDSHLQIIREGMHESVYGARGVVSALKYVPVSVAAKTGTAEFGVKDASGYSTAHAWVIGFYPYEKPEYAFAVLVEGGGLSSVATFAMQDFLNAVY